VGLQARRRRGIGRRRSKSLLKRERESERASEGRRELFSADLAACPLPLSALLSIVSSPFSSLSTLPLLLHLYTS
jgi:hypothetical protein